METVVIGDLFKKVTRQKYCILKIIFEKSKEGCVSIFTNHVQVVSNKHKNCRHSDNKSTAEKYFYLIKISFKFLSPRLLHKTQNKYL